MSRYIDADELIKAIETELWDWETVDGIKSSTVLKQTISDIKNIPTADVVEVEPLKNYITNLTSNIPQTDYVKDDYDAGFADALRIIYTHLCEDGGGNRMTYEFNSPMLKEDWDKLQDNEMEDTDEVIFTTPSGKKKLFRKVIRGWWMQIEPFNYQCFNCSALTPIQFNFCPNCGADMRGESE